MVGQSRSKIIENTIIYRQDKTRQLYYIFIVVDTRSVETTILLGGRIYKCITHSDVLCKLLADNMESLSTSFLKTSKVESGHFGCCVLLL